MFFLKKFLHSFFSHLSFSFSLSPCKQISLSLFSLTPSFSSFFLFLKTFPSFLLARVSLICTYFSLLIFSNLPSSPPFFFHPYHLISLGGGKTLCLFLSIFPCMIIIVLLNNFF
jgi:hypothetical protein